MTFYENLISGRIFIEHEIDIDLGSMYDITASDLNNDGISELLVATESGVIALTWDRSAGEFKATSILGDGIITQVEVLPTQDNNEQLLRCSFFINSIENNLFRKSIIIRTISI